MLIVLATGPFLIAWIGDAFIFKCYNNRYMIISIAPYYILTARGIVLIFRKFIFITAFTLFLLTGMSFHVIISHINHLTGIYSDQPVKALMEINKYYGRYKNSYLLIENAYYFDYHLNKYCAQIPNDKIKIIDHTTKDLNTEIMNFINKQEPDYIWLIDNSKKEHYLILNNSYKQIYCSSYKNWDVYLFKAKK
ncbi:hypothetical protein MASR1M68_04990 [Elusimicrobiota bacterium]